MPSKSKAATLIEMPLAEACRMKYAMGAREHRPNLQTGFAGDPLVELYAELVDGINYANECQKRNYDMREIIRKLADMAQHLQRLHRARAATTGAIQ